MRVLNTALEVAGTVIEKYPSLVNLIQDRGCKYLFQLARSENPAVLYMSLRVIASMFETMAAFVLGDHMAGQTFDPPLDGGGYARLLARERRPFRTRDGYLCALLYNDTQWRSFYAAIGRAEISRGGDSTFLGYALAARVWLAQLGRGPAWHDRFVPQVVAALHELGAQSRPASNRKAAARLPAAAKASAWARSRRPSETHQPSSRSFRAIAAPTPRPPPEIIATFIRRAPGRRRRR